MGERNARRGQNDLRAVELYALQGAKTSNFSYFKFGKQPEKRPYILVVHITPELPEMERIEAFFIEPHGPLRRLVHLLAIGCCQQRHDQAKERRALQGLRR